ncbi:hypothetical protein C0992_005700, partial [Termitomyces sp. T32_za158]
MVAEEHAAMMRRVQGFEPRPAPGRKRVTRLWGANHEAMAREESGYGGIMRELECKFGGAGPDLTLGAGVGMGHRDKEQEAGKAAMTTTAAPAAGG